MGIYTYSGGPEKKSGYDTAQICKNGHVANSSYHDMPQFNKKFCDQCGEETTTVCLNCGAEIRGYLRGSLSLSEKSAPKYCIECGNPYTWTERKLEAFHEYSSDLNELSYDEKIELQESINDLARKTPKSQMAEKKFKRIMGKLGKDSYVAIKDIVVDIVSETARKALFDA